MPTQINWTDLQCDHCSNLAAHVCIDDVGLDEYEEPNIHLALCDDCYGVLCSGTIWLHWEDEDTSSAGGASDRQRKEEKQR